jgi:hypothetical protein
MRYSSRGDLGPIFIGMTQIGWHSDFGLVVEGHVSIHQPVGTVRSNNISGAGGTRYIGAGLSVAYWPVPNWGVSIGVEGGLAVQANAATPSFTLGLEHQ